MAGTQYDGMLTEAFQIGSTQSGKMVMAANAAHHVRELVANDMQCSKHADVVYILLEAIEAALVKAGDDFEVLAGMAHDVRDELIHQA